jgi:hypothetical protein
MVGRLPKRTSDPKDREDEYADGNARPPTSGQKCNESCRKRNYENKDE